MKIAFGIVAHEHHLLHRQPQLRQVIPVNARIWLALAMLHRTRHALDKVCDAKPFEVGGNKARMVCVSKH